MPGWHNSNRRDQLPRDWHRIRAQILRRDPTCQACGINASVDVDHITPGDNHDPANLQGLCRHCHKQKTIAERPASGTQFRSNKRPPEPHPGLISKSQQRRMEIMSEQPNEQQVEGQEPLEADTNDEALAAGEGDEGGQDGAAEGGDTAATE